MNNGVRFDPEAIRELARILAESGLTEIEIADEGARVRLARIPAAVVAAPAPPAPPPAPMPAAAPGPETSAEPKIPDDAIVSPMVGVAYLSSEPGALPYVATGERVTAGQTLLLIEAMKTFNQIRAPRDGVVGKILIASGTPVEYGQALLVLE